MTVEVRLNPYRSAVRDVYENGEDTGFRVAYAGSGVCFLFDEVGDAAVRNPTSADIDEYVARRPPRLRYSRSSLRLQLADIGVRTSDADEPKRTRRR